MAYLDWLEKTLASKLSEKPIGEPVVVRAFYQLTPDHGVLIPVLAAATSMAASWLGSRPARVYAQGGAAHGYATVLAEFAGGQTALITSETAQPEGHSVRVLIIGNHGTLSYHDAPGGGPVLAPDSAGNRRLHAAIERSLRAGRTVEVEHG